jgi:peptide-methionine (S)-S-oxide reductase
MKSSLSCALVSALLVGSAGVSAQGMDTAYFAGGCFWTMENTFDGEPGVETAISGYMGGSEAHPTYEEVSSGRTNYAETVEVKFDPAKITYAKLLDIYWHHIDPTQENGQACDNGRQYRSIVFYHDARQQRQAKAYLDTLRKSWPGGDIVVSNEAAMTFWPAEEEHQDFARRNSAHYSAYRIGCGRDRRLAHIWGSAP